MLELVAHCRLPSLFPMSESPRIIQLQCRRIPNRHRRKDTVLFRLEDPRRILRPRPSRARAAVMGCLRSPGRQPPHHRCQQHNRPRPPSRLVRAQMSDHSNRPRERELAPGSLRHLRPSPVGCRIHRLRSVTHLELRHIELQPRRLRGCHMHHCRGRAPPPRNALLLRKHHHHLIHRPILAWRTRIRNTPSDLLPHMQACLLPPVSPPQP